MKTGEIIGITTVAYLMVATILYYGFQAIGVGEVKSLIESIVTATTLITLLFLYLLGSKWRKEIDHASTKVACYRVD